MPNPLKYNKKFDELNEEEKNFWKSIKNLLQILLNNLPLSVTSIMLPEMPMQKPMRWRKVHFG
jgi:hypothetical protein